MLALLLAVCSTLQHGDGSAALVPGLAVEDEIREGDPRIESDRLGESGEPAHGKAYRLQVDESGPFAIDLHSHWFDAYLLLRDEAGALVAEDDDGLFGTHARLLAELTAGVTYRVEAAARRGGRGAFEIVVHRGVPPTPSAKERAALALDDARRRVTVVETALGPDRLELADALTGLGDRLLAGSDVEGTRAAWERALSIREAVLGPEHLDVAQTRNNLAVVLSRLGDETGARRHHERALGIRERILGPDDPVVAWSLNNLASTVVDDDPGLALRLHERALAIREAALGPDHPNVARSLSNVATRLHAAGDFAGALPLLERAVAIFEATLEPGDRTLAIGLSNLAEVHKALGHHADAQRLHERSLHLREAAWGPSSLDVAESLRQLAAVHERQGRYAEAQDLLERSLAIALERLGPDHPVVATTLNDVAVVFHAQGRSADALLLYERALAIDEARLGPEHASVATTLGNMASVLADTGDVERAMELHERALGIKVAIRGPEHPSVATTLNALAICHEQRGNYAEALALHDRALAIRLKALPADHPRVAVTLSNKALLLRAMGDVEGARRLHLQVLAIREAVFGPVHPDVAASLNNLAVVTEDLGDLVEALRLHERALEVFEETLDPGHPAVATSLGNQGELLSALGDDGAARRLHERALAIREARLGPDHPDVGLSLNNLVPLLCAGGEYDRARRDQERAVAIFERARGPDHPDVAHALHNLAGVMSAQGDRAGARRAQERALAIREERLGEGHPDVAESLSALALLDMADGAFDAARARLERALTIRETALGDAHPAVARSASTLAGLYADQGDHERAWTLLRRTEERRRDHLDEALALLGEAESHLYLAEQFWQLELTLSVAPAVPDADVPAYESLLAWKGQVLRTSLFGGRRRRAGVSAEARACIGRLRDIQAILLHRPEDMARRGPASESPIDGLIAERRRLERELRVLMPATEPVRRRWTDLRAALPADAALVDLLIHRPYEPPAHASAGAGAFAEPRVSAWITRADLDRPIRLDLGAAAEMEHAIQRLLALQGRRGEEAPTGEADPNESSRRLLWDRLAPHLDGVSTVIVSPDGPLATLPLGILRLEDGRYLVEDRHVVTMTDPTTLFHIGTDGHRDDHGSLLAIGGVDYEAVAGPPGDSFASARGDRAPRRRSRSDGGAWPPLEGTGPEAERVIAAHARTHPAGERLLLTGAAAAEEAVKRELPGHAVIHLATHGFFEPEGVRAIARRRFASSTELSRDVGAAIERLGGYYPGLLSALVCAGANRDGPKERDDGLLTAEEIGALDLSGVALVTLSACETGLGEARSGEGLLGLRRSMLAAGARTVVSSLWRVDDESTSELMAAFYENLWDEGMGLHEALRAAQLERLEQNRVAFGHAMPWTWGAFVLDGRWR